MDISFKHRIIRAAKELENKHQFSEGQFVRLKRDLSDALWRIDYTCIGMFMEYTTPCVDIADDARDPCNLINIDCVIFVEDYPGDGFIPLPMDSRYLEPYPYPEELAN